jgi:hypothetical protein
VPVGEREPPELVVWDEFLDQRKELSLLEPDVCVEQRSRRSQRLLIDDAGRHGDLEFASEPFELHVLEACLAEGSRLRLDVPEEKREELFFLIAKVDTLFVPEELHEFPGGRKPSRRISVRGSPAQLQCLHESIVMVARERDQGGVALHAMTLGCSVIRAVLGELRGPLDEDELVVNMVTHFPDDHECGCRSCASRWEASAFLESRRIAFRFRDAEVIDRNSPKATARSRTRTTPPSRSGDPLD